MYCSILLWEMICIKTTRLLVCEYKHKNYLECALMLYTKWTSCNGTCCPLGLQRRLKGICCPFSADERTVAMVKTACKINCNLSVTVAVYFFYPIARFNTFSIDKRSIVNH